LTRICPLLYWTFAVPSFRGAATGCEPGSHIPEACVHGFRARRCAAPRNDGILRLPCNDLPPKLPTAPHRRPGPNRVEQRPVAILQHMALRKGGPRLQAKRADDAVVAVVTLQDDAGQR